MIERLESIGMTETLDSDPFEPEGSGTFSRSFSNSRAPFAVSLTKLSGYGRHDISKPLNQSKSKSRGPSEGPSVISSVAAEGSEQSRGFRATLPFYGVSSVTYDCLDRLGSPHVVDLMEAAKKDTVAYMAPVEQLVTALIEAKASMGDPDPSPVRNFQTVKSKMTDKMQGLAYQEVFEPVSNIFEIFNLPITKAEFEGDTILQERLSMEVDIVKDAINQWFRSWHRVLPQKARPQCPDDFDTDERAKLREYATEVLRRNNITLEVLPEETSDRLVREAMDDPQFPLQRGRLRSVMLAAFKQICGDWRRRTALKANTIANRGSRGDVDLQETTEDSQESHEGQQDEPERGRERERDPVGPSDRKGKKRAVITISSDEGQEGEAGSSASPPSKKLKQMD